MLIKEMPVNERPREKMLRYGCQSLSNAELIAAIIGTGSRNASAVHIAERLLAMDEEGLRYLGGCTVQELSKVEGIGTAKACQLSAALELGRRISTMPSRQRIRIGNPEDIAQLFMERMRHYRQEHFQVLLLDAAGGIISIEEVAIGGLMSAPVHPREAFSMAIRKSAAAVALVHNHPSGSLIASDADLEITKRFQDAGSILGIPVIDHIIIGDGRYISLKNRQLM